MSICENNDFILFIDKFQSSKILTIIFIPNINAYKINCDFIKINQTKWLSLLNKHKSKIKSSISPNTHSPSRNINKILTLFNLNKNDKFFMADIKINTNNLLHAPPMNLTPENCNVSSKLFIHSVSTNSIHLLNV